MDKKSTKDQNTGRAFMDIVGSAHYSYAGKYLADFSLSGADSSLLKLGITLDAFYDHRTDILVGGTGAVSGVFGMSVPQINNGVIGGQFSFARNKIVNQNEQYRPYDYLKRTGREMGINWGYEVIGIYKSQEDIDNRNVKQLLSEVTPGDLMFKDQNGDGVIDSYDQIPLGYSSLCLEIYYSFDLGAEWKGIGFNAQFQGVGTTARCSTQPASIVLS